VSDADLYFPHEQGPGTVRSAHNYMVVGRLKPTSTIEAARAEMTTLSKSMLATYGNETEAADVEVRSLRDYLVSNYQTMLAVVFGAYGLGKWQSLIGIVFGCWVIISSLFDPIDRLRRKLSLPRAVIGMTIAHIGIGVCVIGVSAVESYTVERDVALRPGETVALGRYAYRLEKVDPVEGPNYEGVRGELTVLRDGRPLTVLHPELRTYWVQRSTMKEASIDARWNIDLFSAMGEDMGEGRWGLRAQLRPLIGYVWLSAFLMALGGALAASDRRYRARRLVEESAVVPGTANEAS